MTDITEVVDVSVSVESAALSAAGFGRALILGTHTRFAEVARLYSSAAAMLADGFLTSDLEYQEALSFFSQSAEADGRKPPDVLIGRRATPVAQVITLTVVYDAAGQYSVTIGQAGMDSIVIGPIAANTDAPTTATDIATAINGNATLAAILTAAPVGSTVTLTSDVAGIPFTATPSVTGGAATFTGATTTANVGVPEDLAGIEAAGFDWYATLLTSRTKREQVEAAIWTEGSTRPRICFLQSSEAALIAATYSAGSPYADIGSELKALNYHRTALVYASSDTNMVAAAWAGARLPFTPGTQTWAIKKLVGVLAETLTATQYAFLTGTAAAPTSGKNVNVYQSLGQVSVMLRGQMASGRYIDVTRVADYLADQVEVSVGNLMLGEPKIPYTTGGLALVEAAIRQPLVSAKEQGILADDEEILVTMPAIGSVSAADRTNRLLNPPAQVAVVYSGAIHKAQINISLAA